MNLAKLALPLFALAAPLHAAPASGVGEIPLHIEATATAAPDSTLVLIRIEGQGASQDAARAALDAPRAEMNRALGELGVADKDRIKPLETEEVSLSAESAALDAAADAAVAACNAAEGKRCKAKRGGEYPSSREYIASEQWQITLRQPQGMARLSAIEGENLHVMPVEGLSNLYADPAKAREDAIAKAIASAREEAGRYAAALGYKVLRIERVSNTKPALNLPDIVGTFAMMDKRAAREAFLQQGTMTVGVAIDFVIAPK